MNMKLWDAKYTNGNPGHKRDIKTVMTAIKLLYDPD